MSVNGSTITGARVDHFATFQFHVEIDGKPVATFSECGGLEHGCILQDLQRF